MGGEVEEVAATIIEVSNLRNRELERERERVMGGREREVGVLKRKAIYPYVQLKLDPVMTRSIWDLK